MAFGVEAEHSLFGVGSRLDEFGALEGRETSWEEVGSVFGNEGVDGRHLIGSLKVRPNL
jgi:hypothetical protein